MIQRKVIEEYSFLPFGVMDSISMLTTTPKIREQEEAGKLRMDSAGINKECVEADDHRGDDGVEIDGAIPPELNGFFHALAMGRGRVWIWFLIY